MADKRANGKPKRRGFLERITNHLREAASLGRVLVKEPRAFPGAARRSFKRFLRDLWNARGGGMYACGFVITFLWLEAATLVDEVVSSGSLAAFVSEQFFEFLFRFTVQSLQNTIGAFLWPVYLVQVSPLFGGVTLAALWFIFPRYIKPVVTRWLFDDDEEGADKRGEEARG